jgi:hypothetical protein
MRMPQKRLKSCDIIYHTECCDIILNDECCDIILNDCELFKTSVQKG